MSELNNTLRLDHESGKHLVPAFGCPVCIEISRVKERNPLDDLVLEVERLSEIAQKLSERLIELGGKPPEEKKRG